MTAVRIILGCCFIAEIGCLVVLVRSLITQIKHYYSGG